jgi:A/G-specific adenine glycosylase
MWNIVDRLLPDHRVADYIQAQMDLGATVCTRTKPNCEQCPMKAVCQAYLSGNPTAYPSPKPKKVTPQKAIKWLVYLNQDNKIWLEKRPDTGIWGGLWSFPEVLDEQDLHLGLLNYPFQCVSQQTVEDIHHVFTHFKLRITPELIRCQTQQDGAHQHGQWYTILESLELGLPAPVRSFIKSME